MSNRAIRRLPCYFFSQMLHVISPGILSLIQDLGRPHMQPFAVPASGAMDAFACRAANALLGNAPDAACVEITGGGAMFEFDRDAVFALTGADFDPTLNGRAVPTWAAVYAPKGAQLALAGRRVAWGARAYLALPGGVDVPPVLGSRSTYVPGGFGGLGGRALRAGDALFATQPLAAFDTLRHAGRIWPAEAKPAYQTSPTVRVMVGPHAALFAPAALSQLVAQPLRITSTSNRMGYRFEGCPPLRYAKPLSLASLGVCAGVIQVPPDGSPILLTADAQTTGGYPVIGVVIQADLPLVGQCLPGDRLQFVVCDAVEAIAALRQMHAWLVQGALEDDYTLGLAWRGAGG